MKRRATTPIAPTSGGPLAGRIVALTGGANGIGEATVRRFHEEGATICFGDVDTDAGRRLAASLSERARFIPLDLLREASIRSWIGKIASEHGRIDVLVNNAATDPRIPIESLEIRDWDRILNLNLRAYMLTVREALPSLAAGSSIVNLSSLTFHTAPPAMSAYVASKAGIQGLTRSLARELGPRGIRVNTVSPGWVMTERQLRQYVTPEVKRLIRRSQCVPDLLRPEEIADVILFLAGPQSRAVTGQEILADRGWAHS